MKKRVQSESYRDMQCFVNDVHRVFDHAMRGDRQQAKTLKREFDFQVKKIMAEIHDTTAKLRWWEPFVFVLMETTPSVHADMFRNYLLTAIRTYATYVERVN